MIVKLASFGFLMASLLLLHLLWFLPRSIQIFQINIVLHHLLLPSLKEVFDRKKLCRCHARRHGWSSGHGFIIVKVKICCFVVYMLVALNPKKMGKSRGDLAFTVKGFSNWKDGTIGIKKHEVSGSHKGALQVMVVIPST